VRLALPGDSGGINCNSSLAAVSSSFSSIPSHVWKPYS
jgi:hypothetical protein